MEERETVDSNKSNEPFSEGVGLTENMISKKKKKENKTISARF